MPEKGYTPIQVIPLFKGKTLSAGDKATSDPIDLRYVAQRGNFSLSHVVGPGTYGSSGTTVFSYVGCTVFGGTYIKPYNAGTIGTAGTSASDAGNGTNMVTFSPVISPFIKVIATQTGTGTQGADSVVTAELIVD
jgi:hypothetical protein